MRDRCRHAGSAPLVLLVLAFGAAVVIACAPDIATDDDMSETLPFDPAATPPLLPQPTNLIVNPATGRLDFGVVGMKVPKDCAAQADMPVAQCELYRYLEALDGFPTDTSATAPTTAPVELSSLRRPGAVVVVDATREALVTDLQAVYDAAGKQIAVVPRAGWQVGRTYFVGIRGYAGGIRSSAGRPFVASVPYLMLKQTSSLTCGARTAAELDPRCPWAVVAATPQSTPAQLFRDLSDLESIRVLYDQDLRLWDVLSRVGSLPRAEAATAWAIPMHSGSVIELNPTLGRLPRVVSSSRIELAVNGDLQPDTLSPAGFATPGTVYLLDLTALEKNDLAGGLPAFSVTWDGKALALQATAPLVDGHLVCILVSTGVTNPAGTPLVAPPMTVLLRSRGELVDAAGRSQVEGVTDADAAELEQGRRDLKELLDDPLFQAVTHLERESIAYVYAFTFPNP
jgi:hypothetical protein